MAHIQDRGREHDRRWQARYRDPDGRERSKTFARKLDAQRWLNEVTTDLVTGRYVSPDAGRITFRDYAERWLDGQPHRPSTASLYRRLLTLHVFPVLGDRQLDAVRRSDVQAWVAAFARTHAAETVRGTYARVHHLPRGRRGPARRRVPVPARCPSATRRRSCRSPSNRRGRSSTPRRATCGRS